MGVRSATKTRPGRPLKPLITREAAVKAAIELLDRAGIDALSVQAVARAMSVTAPSLYYHFKDKDELLQLVALTLLREVGQDAPVGASWKDRAIALSIATRRMILRHPNAAPLMLRFFPRNLMLGAYETTLGDCPYPVQHHFAILEALEKLAYGAALFAAAAEAHHIPAMPAFDTGRYPRLAAALQAGPSDEALFIETLELLFDGFAARYGQA
jgi:TetR/AcrR family transcriptional regulator, tetracycline repressor protein